MRPHDTLHLVLPRDNEPLALEIFEDGQRVVSRFIVDDGGRLDAVTALRHMAHEVGSRPATFANRLLCISLHGLDLGRLERRQDRSLPGHVAELLVPRLRRLLEEQEIFLEVARDLFLVISPRRDPERCRRWAGRLRQIARSLLGEEGFEAIRVYNLNAGNDERIIFGTCECQHCTHEECPDWGSTLSSLSSPTELLACTIRKPVGGWTLYYHDEPKASNTQGFQAQRLEIARYETGFAPTWDTRNKVISLFTVVPARGHGRYRRYGFAAVPEALEHDRLLHGLCIELLEAAAAQIRMFVANGQAGMIAVPVHFDALATNWRLTGYVRVLRSIELDIARRLCITITDVPAGVNGHKLQGIVDTLRKSCRAVFLQIGFNEPQWVMRHVSKIQAVGMEIRNDARSEDDLIRHLSRFADACRRCHVDAYVTGLDTTSLVLAAAAAGIRFVSGARILTPGQVPEGARRYDWMDFYMQDRQ